MKADEVRLYALRGGLKKQAVCYTHFHSNKVFRGDYNRKTPRRKDTVFWWARVDSDHRSENATDLQSAPIGHSGTRPYLHRKKMELVDGLEPPTC